MQYIKCKKYVLIRKNVRMIENTKFVTFYVAHLYKNIYKEKL